ncbi:winged helix-turn-helix domain-containing protein [Porticoccaceae bacterium LTM1]|nr:winged helix-turn-helix domain-containing protein [Porticoccaceae bacterium LTM1]
MDTDSRPSKQAIAFNRKLYLAHLIDSGQYSVPSLEEVTGMPRRTIQDTLKTLSDIGIEVVFTPKPGARHNEGSYQVSSWGPIHKKWVKNHLESIKAVL